jgi:hypothetical protein
MSDGFQMKTFALALALFLGMDVIANEIYLCDEGGCDGEEEAEEGGHTKFDLQAARRGFYALEYKLFVLPSMIATYGNINKARQWIDDDYVRRVNRRWIEDNAGRGLETYQ